MPAHSAGITIVQCEKAFEPVVLEKAVVRLVIGAEELPDAKTYTQRATNSPLALNEDSKISLPKFSFHHKKTTTAIKKKLTRNAEPADVVKWVLVGLVTALLFVLFIVFLAQAAINPGLIVSIGAIVAIGIGVFMIVYFTN